MSRERWEGVVEGVKAKKWEGVQEVVYYVSALPCLSPRFSFLFLGLILDYLVSVLCPAFVLV